MKSGRVFPVTDPCSYVGVVVMFGYILRSEPLPVLCGTDIISFAGLIVRFDATSDDFCCLRIFEDDWTGKCLCDEETAPNALQEDVPDAICT